MKKIEKRIEMQDLTLDEMKKVNGGLANLVWFAIGLIVAECLDRNAGKDFSDGWNAK